MGGGVELKSVFGMGGVEFKLFWFGRSCRAQIVKKVLGCTSFLAKTWGVNGGSAADEGLLGKEYMKFLSGMCNRIHFRGCSLEEWAEIVQIWAS